MIRKSGNGREASGYRLAARLCFGVVLALSCASSAGAEKAAEDGKAAPPAPAAPAREAAAPPKPSAPPEELARLLEERQRELDRRETAVRKDEERVRILRQSIEALLKKQAKQNAKAQAAAGGVSSMAHVSQAFETMPVEEAAQRIEKMNDHLAVEMLSRLKSKTTGQILAAINPAKAARLVEKLAVRPPGGGADGPAKGVKN
jgi:flagellar motility protein MotE (MotC chaperone)